MFWRRPLACLLAHRKLVGSGAWLTGAGGTELEGRAYEGRACMHEERL